jgi:hypothetical protein
LAAVTPGVEIVTGLVHEPAAGRFAVSIALPADEPCSQMATALPLPSMPTFGTVDEFAGEVIPRSKTRVPGADACTNWFGAE